MHILGNTKALEDYSEIIVKNSDFTIRVTANGKFILDSDKKSWKRLLLNFLSIAFRASYCVKCGSCINNCPRKAISYNEKGVLVNKEACTRCSICNFACPISVYSLPRLSIFRLLQA